MVNVRKIEELTAAGRMRPAGQAEVYAARADGRWDAAYQSQKEAARTATTRAARIRKAVAGLRQSD